MVVPKLPTLSTAGFVQDPAVILERQLSYFFIADYSQSNQHRGRVASLPYLIKMYGNRPEVLIERIDSTLQSMLGAYFDSVSITMDYVQADTSSPEYDITLEGVVTQNGTQYGIARLLTISNNTLKTVADFAITQG